MKTIWNQRLRGTTCKPYVALPKLQLRSLRLHKLPLVPIIGSSINNLIYLYQVLPSPLKFIHCSNFTFGLFISRDRSEYIYPKPTMTSQNNTRNLALTPAGSLWYLFGLCLMGNCDLIIVELQFVSQSCCSSQQDDRLHHGDYKDPKIRYHLFCRHDFKKPVNSTSSRSTSYV
jgi:hypothetical protein